MSLSDAFNAIAQLHSRKMKLSRPVTTSGPVLVNIDASPSNYFRYLAGPGDTQISGHEFLIRSDQLKTLSFPTPIRIGDRLIDTELGQLTIREVVPMYILGATIVGYRVRTG